MITTYLIGQENHLITRLSNDLNNFCPQVKIIEKISSPNLSKEIIKGNKGILVFLSLNGLCLKSFEPIKELVLKYPIELICLGLEKETAFLAYQLYAFQYLLQTYKPNELISSVYNAEKNKQASKQQQVVSK